MIVKFRFSEKATKNSFGFVINKYPNVAFSEYMNFASHKTTCAEKKRLDSTSIHYLYTVHVSNKNSISKQLNKSMKITYNK